MVQTYVFIDIKFQWTPSVQAHCTEDFGILVLLRLCDSAKWGPWGRNIVLKELK